MTPDDIKKLLCNIEFYDGCSQATKEIDDLLSKHFPGVDFRGALTAFVEKRVNGRKAQWMAGYQFGKREVTP